MINIWQRFKWWKGTDNLLVASPLVENACGQRAPVDIYFFSFNMYVSSKADFEKELSVFKQLVFGCYTCPKSSSYWRMNTCRQDQWMKLHSPQYKSSPLKVACSFSSILTWSYLEASSFKICIFFKIRFTSVWKDHTPAIRIQNSLERLMKFPFCYMHFLWYTLIETYCRLLHGSHSQDNETTWANTKYNYSLAQSSHTTR